MRATNSNFYQIGASLPVDAPSYVRREADEVFYQKLQAGKFCYVLNSRQMGKSSLRVQTMQRLQKEGTVCAAIDLTGIGKVSQQQWYGGIVYNLSESCQLEDKFDFDWQEWWEKHQTVLSPVQCLGLFIEKVLLAKIPQPIVIFVDEIDKVLSQEFSADDFFGLIRFFQNQRVDNPIFQRLTFALLGVATPGDLIQNKTQTPFNIGEAIELHGFKFDEVEPLIDGLRGKCDREAHALWAYRSQVVMKEILDWTGGQPFLTQKLCKFMVEESEKDNSLSVKEVVKSRIIENWESQDDPEHLRTIRDRILSSGQRAGYLLELYQQIQQQGEVAAKKNLESSELRLSGLVVQREGKLRVYNQVYQSIFNQNWVEVQLKNLRPYSEAFRAWVNSAGKDESRLLRGLALESAEEWAKDKNLSFQDKQFLAASKEKEIVVRNQEAELERERKDREAAEQRNLVLSEANIKAKRRIRNGTVVLVLAVLGAVGLGVFAAREGNKAFQAQKMFKDANTKADEANQKFEDANIKAEEERKKVVDFQQQTQKLQKIANDAQQQAQKASEKAKAEQIKANNANQKATAAIEQAERAQKSADDANKKVVEAKEQAGIEQRKAKESQKIADDANQKAIEATQKAKAEQTKAQQAKRNADAANRKAQIAKQEAEKLQNQLASAKENFKFVKKDVETVQQLSKLAGELRNENLIAASDEALRQAGLSFRVNDHNLKQAMLFASMSQAYQSLAKKQKDETKEQKDKNLGYQKLVEEKIDESLDYLNKQENNTTSLEGSQIKVLVKANEGKLFANKSKQRAIKAYQEAFYALRNYLSKTNPFKKNQILTNEDIESVHRRLLMLQTNRNQEVWDSLKEHFYTRLENSLKLKNWGAADSITDTLVLFIADRQKQRYLNIRSLMKFSCSELKKLDDLWVQNSQGHFGLSVQKRIWIETGNRFGVKPSDWNQNDGKNYFRFATAVGWHERGGKILTYDEYIKMVYKNPSQNTGGLPFHSWVIAVEGSGVGEISLVASPRLEDSEFMVGRSGLPRNIESNGGNAGDVTIDSGNLIGEIGDEDENKETQNQSNEEERKEDDEDWYERKKDDEDWDEEELNIQQGLRSSSREPLFGTTIANKFFNRVAACGL
ncbi:MAG: AAA-like domain-containing protein [Cyanobacteria bacterium P01_A01_bin.68]